MLILFAYLYCTSQKLIIIGEVQIITYTQLTQQHFVIRSWSVHGKQ